MGSAPPGNFNGRGLEALVSRLHESVVFLDPSATILLTNRAESLPGQPSSELPAHPGRSAELFYPDGRRYETMDWPVVRSLRTGEIIADDECFRLTEAGIRANFSCSSAPIYDGNDQIIAAVLIARDITEQKHSREQLAYLLPMLDLTEEAIVALDPAWRTVAWNQGAERMYGWSAEEAFGRELRSFLRVDQSGEEVAARRREITERGTRHSELRIGRKDGTSLLIEALTVTIRNPRGEVAGYLGIHRNVTERRRAREERARHASVLENVDDAVMTTNERYVLTEWNRGAERMFGWAPSEAIGRIVYELIPSARSDQELAAQLASLVQSGHWRGEITFYGKQGKPVYADANTNALRAGDGTVTGYLSIMRDLSERRLLQDELESRLRQQAAVADFGRTAMETTDLPPLLDEAVTLVCRTLGVEFAKLDELLPDGSTLLVRAGAGWNEGIVGNYTLPTGPSSPSGFALQFGQPVIVDDMTAETRFQVPSLLRAHRVMSQVTVVINPGNQPFGTLAAGSEQRRTFSTDDVSFVQAVANVVAAAVERAQIDNRLDAAREEERRRIARDLHDEALRELSDAIAGATMSRSTETGEETQRWAALIRSLQRVGQRLRSAIYDLRISAREERAFADVLTDMVSIQTELAGEVKTELVGLDALPIRPLGYGGSEVLRIVREAITNARRHSGATLIRVDAGRSTEEALHITVSDDGVWPGRELTVSRAPGAGILSMLQRADLLGADLQIEEQPGGGTAVSLELRLSDRDPHG